jgi:WD40 repeat protein
MVSEVQPYVGPRPFKREDAPFFFGRDREANELRSLIISHSEVLLYAQSGAGKTSLINAKLWNLLEDDDLEVLPLARVQGPQPRSKIANIYVFNTLVKWTNNTATADELAAMTLRAFLESRERSLDEEGLPKPCVAIFDQFEELFTSHSECWQQRRGFFLQVRDALDALPEMRALFAMREDYIAAIDQYASIMPEKFRVRFHLENLREPQAVEAIKGPLTRGQMIRHFGKDVAETLVRELMKVQVETVSERAEPITGEFVEPVQLQVVCQRLWRDLKPEDTEITLAHLETISVEKALLSFYEESIRDVARDTGIDEATLRLWFEQKLVTPAGTRGMVFRGETETEGMPNNAVNALDELHLIRSEQRDGRRWYELTHDRFIDSIQKSRQKLLLSLQAGAEERRQKLEAKAADWVSLGRKKSGLLRDVELLETQRWLDSPDAAALGSSETLLALVESSRAEAQARSVRQRTVLLGILGVLFIVAVVAAGYAYVQRNIAEAKTAEANRQGGIAKAQTTEASRQREIAEVYARIAMTRILAGKSLAYKNSKLDLSLLLSLEASRIAEEISPTTPQIAEAKTHLLADVKRGLLGALVSSPHLRTFLHGHNNAVRSVAFSPDGKILASGDYDGELILWDLAGYPLGPPLQNHNGLIYSVAFSRPDGNKVASCGSDGNIVLRDVEKPEKIIKSVPVGQGKLYSIAFSPDGNTIGCGTESGIIILYDIGHDSISHLPKRHTGKVYSVAFSPKGNKLASAGEDKRIIFWDFNRRKSEWTVADTNEVFSVAFSPDGKTLASGDMDENVTLWDIEKRKRLEPLLKGHTNAVFSVAFSPDGETLASASTDKTIRRWKVKDRKPDGEPLTGSSEKVYSVAFNPDGKTLASGAERGVTVLWDTTNQSLLAQPVFLARPASHENWPWMSSIAFTSDGKTMAAGDFDGNIVVVGDNVYETFQPHYAAVSALAFNSEGNTFASAAEDGTIKLHTWDGKAWNRSSRSLPKQAKTVRSIAFRPKDDKTLASGGDDGVILWDLSNGTSAGTPLTGAPVNSLAFSPDGKMLASGNKDTSIILWDVAKREPLKPLLQAHIDEVFTVAFSPDGRVLASGGKDTAVVLWDVAARRLLDIPFRDHTAGVSRVAFSQDGTTLASCSYDKSIILWDIATREAIGQLVTEDQHNLYDVAFTSDGVLVSAGWGLTYWDTNIESLRSKAEHVAARNLTHDKWNDEWRRFLGDRPYRPTSLYGSVKEADRLALHREFEKAREAFKQVVAVAVKTKDATLNNEVGWYGSLDGFAEIVLPACDRAIEKAKDEDKPLCRDTRGVALALTKKFKEAIKDFEALKTGLKGKEKALEAKAAEDKKAGDDEKSAEDEKAAAVLKKMRQKREAWIATLKAGQSPFDKQTLMDLRREGGAE